MSGDKAFAWVFLLVLVSHPIIARRCSRSESSSAYAVVYLSGKLDLSLNLRPDSSDAFVGVQAAVIQLRMDGKGCRVDNMFVERLWRRV